MATPEINENCHYMENDPHKCRIKLGKFHFDIFCCFGVIKESLPASYWAFLAGVVPEVFSTSTL